MMRSTVIGLILVLATPYALAFPLRPVGDPIAGRTTLVASQASQEREPGPASLEEAIEIAVKRFGGRAVKADTVVRDGRRVYEIQLFDEQRGNVRTVTIDPETGAVIPPPRR
jgi:Peptidase propeptide and YPEB domain